MSVTDIGNSGVDNILAVWRAATGDEVREGLSWYGRARAEILAALPWADPVRACGVVAALSPQTAWPRNVQLAVAMWRVGFCPAPRDRRRKAQAIIRGEHPRTVLNRTTRFHGKERCFFECLRNPGNTGFCCIDGHAYSVWLGERVTTTEVGRFHYRTVETDYMMAADVAGVLPNQIQATTWITWRRMHQDDATRRLMGPWKMPIGWVVENDRPRAVVE
jgi:hypothetical protein